MDKIISEIDNMLINNDKHIIKIIMNYMFNKCIRCNRLRFDEDLKEMIDNEYICNGCFNLFEFRCCFTCGKYYEIARNIFCASCSMNCKIYCSICVNLEYTRGFNPVQQLMIMNEILDRVIARISD